LIFWSLIYKWVSGTLGTLIFQKTHFHRPDCTTLDKNYSIRRIAKRCIVNIFYKQDFAVLFHLHKYWSIIRFVCCS